MINDWHGINYPFVGGIQKIFTRQMGTKLVKNDILQLLYTNPGERVYRPNFGVGIARYVFELNDATIINELKRVIYEQMKMHEPRVNVDSIDIKNDKHKYLLNISIKCSLVKSPNESLTVELNIPNVARQK